MTHEVKPLTSLRALAAAVVFLYHFPGLWAQLAPQSLQFIARQGFIGVDIFFVLSGFILVVRYHDEFLERRFSLSAYIRRRIARIYPLYFTILFLTALLTWQLPNILNLTLTQGFFLNYFASGVPTAWSLTVEECFYLIFPIILLSVIMWRRPIVILVIFMVWTGGFLWLGSVSYFAVRDSGLQLQAGFLGDSSNGFYIFSFTIFGYLFNFTIGMFLAMAFVRGNTLNAWQSTLLSLVGLGGIFGCQWIIDTYFSKSFMIQRGLVYGIAAFAAILIFSLTCETAPLSRLLSVRPLVFLGRISFALYLIQLTPLMTFMNTWSIVPLYLGANAISAILHLGVEQPMHRVIMQWGKKPVIAQPVPIIGIESTN